MVDGSRHNQCVVEPKFGLIVIFMVHKMIRFDNVKAHLTSSNQEKFSIANVRYVEIANSPIILRYFFSKIGDSNTTYPPPLTNPYPYRSSTGRCAIMQALFCISTFTWMEILKIKKKAKILLEYFCTKKMPLPLNFEELSKPLNFKAHVPKLFFLNAFASYSLNRTEPMIKCEALIF